MMVVEKVETSRSTTELAAEAEKSLTPAVVRHRNLAGRSKHNLHGEGMLLHPAVAAEFMRRQWLHRVSNRRSVAGNNHRAIARHRSAIRILADSPASSLLRQSRSIPQRVRGSVRIRA